MPDGLSLPRLPTDLGQLPADLWETRLPPRCVTARRTSRSATAKPCGSATAKSGAAGPAKATANGSPASKPIYSALDRAGITDNTARRPANAKPAAGRHGPRRGRNAADLRADLSDLTKDPVLREACYRC